MNHIMKVSRIHLRQLSTSPGTLAVSCSKPDYGLMEVQRTRLLNGIRVAAAKPLGATIASCTIMFQAGSRYEVDDQLGATHFIRACSTAGGCGYTSFGKMRMLQQHGVSITCTSDRQTVAFTMRCPPVKFPELKYYLIDMAARCCFNEWEVEDRKPLVRDDLARITPEQRVLDLVQSASWTGPLANSTFCCDSSSLLKHAVIAAACGTDDAARGQHAWDRSPLTPVRDMAGDDVCTQYRAFNISYMETGIFGILAKTRASTAWKVTLAASEFLANVGDLSFKQIENGKARLKLGLALHDEDCVRVSEGLALQLANDVQIDSAGASIAMVDQLCNDDISCTAKMLSSRSCQMSLAVVGDIGAVPHDRELMCERY